MEPLDAEAVAGGERDVVALLVLRVGVPAHHEAHRVHLGEQAVGEGVLGGVGGERREVVEEGASVDAVVGHAGLHDRAVLAAHPDDHVLARQVPVSVVRPLIDLGVGHVRERAP